MVTAPIDPEILEPEYLPTTPSGPASPAVVYLASLGSNRSRETQRNRLDKIARLITVSVWPCAESRPELDTSA